MKIIHLTLGKANPERMNGVSKAVYEMCTAQKDAELDVELWGISTDVSINFSERNFKTTVFKSSKNIFLLPNGIKEEIKKHTHQKNILFHIHGGFIPTWFSIVLLLNKLNIPYLFTPHGSYNSIALQKSKWRKKIYTMLFENRLLKGTKKIHLLGKSELENIENRFKKKCILIPNFIQINNKISKHEPNSEKLRLLTLGRIDIKTKGLDLLVEAIKILTNKKIPIECTITGTGSDSKKLAQLIEQNNLLSYINCTGAKFNAEKKELFHTHDILLQPSRNEGIPMSVLEACSYGTPVLVSTATNVEDNIEKYNAGYVFKSENITDLVKKIEQIYEDKKQDKLKSIGNNAKEMIAKEYSQETVLKKIITCYEEICDRYK